MLVDRLTGERREVDVCIHAKVSGKPVTLALECRDHRRKADQIWVDGLIGKYRNLPVDKVIAVARAGFTRSAAKAAERAGIQTLTLEQATSAKWHLIAELPDQALVVLHVPTIEAVTLRLRKGQPPIEMPSVSEISLSWGGQTARLASILERYATSEQVMDRAFADGSLMQFPLIIAVREDCLLVLPSGETRRLERIEVEIAINRNKSDTDFERRIYGDSGVSFASKEFMRANVTVSMLQQDGATSVGATVRAPDGKTATVCSLKTEWPKAPRR